MTMRQGKMVPLMAGGLAVWATGAAQAQQAATTATLTIDAGAGETVQVSPTLYGAFFEEINHAGEGGLYPEMLRNRSFQERDRKQNITGWQGVGGATLFADTLNPLNAANQFALRVTTPAGLPGRAGVANTGFWGVPVRRGATYRYLVHARTMAPGATLTLTLESATGQVYARKTLNGANGDWQAFDGTLKADGDDAQARLVITTDKPGVLWLGHVSLLPTDTFRGRENGLRPDLAQMVADMKPAFLRFPGGNYIEGYNLANAYHWPRTIGPVTDRPGHYNDAWGYWSTDGLGYHEFLQYCEDIGAAPLFGVNCGIAMGPHRLVPLNGLDPWIQEALDAIEYANGPVSTPQGARRAANGHPKPFGLKYIEIGNENGIFGGGNGDGGTRTEYTERYLPFYNAIKARYPDIVCIATAPINAPADLVDDHYYNSPTWFWQNANRYDRVSRSGPKIFVGEYAVTRGAGLGNLKAGLAEAAFMMGLERNSDVVKLASYAPLFVNVHDRAWNPDTIGYDNERAYGTPSYWVQVLLAQNRPDALIPATFAASSVAPSVAATGSIGLGAWNTQVEYKDITVTQGGNVLYTSAFASGDAAGWKPQQGDWSLADGVYRQTTIGTNDTALLQIPALQDAGDYTLRLKARKTGGAEGFLILFHAPDMGNYYWWNVGGWQNTEHGLEKSAGGVHTELGDRVRGHIDTDRWYDVRVEVAGHTIRCFLDDKLIQTVSDAPPLLVAANAGRVGRKGELVVKVVNDGDTALTTQVNLAGVQSVDSDGEAITLAGTSGNDENSLDAPNKVAPVTRSLTGIAPRFTYTFPAHSLTVLRLRGVRR